MTATPGINPYNTAELLGAFGVLDRPKMFLLELFYKFEQTFDTEEVLFDKVERARKIAAFVAPEVAGKADRSRGYAAMSFRPPYVKPMHTVDPSKAMKRRAGEQLLGRMTPEQRYLLAIADNMLLEDDEISRREEWMAAQTLLSGAFTAEGEEFAPMLIDLNRNSQHTVVLTADLVWGTNGIDPLQNIRSWARMVQRNSGYHPRAVVFDPLAGDMFIQSTSVLRIMQSFRQTEGNIDLIGKITGGAVGQEVAYLGSLPEFDFYQYQQLYTDDAGNIQQYMPDNSVIMGAPFGVQGVRTYGAIKDKRAGLQSLSRFPKIWDQENPSATMSMTQSAPLPLLGWVDASLGAKVA